jgi:formylmethanofuran dehydrogenase subunit E
VSDGKDYPVICTECGWQVWRSRAVILGENTYCEECADKEPEQEQSDG